MRTTMAAAAAGSREKLRLAQGLREDGMRLCTNSGHSLVDGLHSIENTCTYKRVFFVD